MFSLDSRISNLSDRCTTFIELKKNEVGELCNSTNLEKNIMFKADQNEEVQYEKCVQVLSNISIEFNNDEDGQLPGKIGFLEMYEVGEIEQLNCKIRWMESNPILNLQAPVGVGKNGQKISIDLHEKFHGPHGLIAGMTGSGKSEFIISYILSMAICYHPYEVQFILIDYKGGGLAGAFENKSTGLKLPHLAGTITNLDANEIKRSLASIESELKRRQALFNQAREISGESTIDIYKYQKMYRDKVVTEPVSHLFIISDEFAELKNQQPEFMDQLISTARIGRSLGVHLILATQKPSGVVDPQIWSNTRFRVCLRVQDKSDSNEIIKCPDAAFLKQTGRFYFQVGYNEVFILGQASWAGGKYIPSKNVNKTIDTSINFINHIGYPIKTIQTREKREVKSDSKGEELLNIVKYLADTAKELNVFCKPLWLEKIPDFITVENLAFKYQYQKENFILNPIIGEYDVPSKQEQRLLTLPITKEGNTIVYGASGSGKENFIITLLYSSMLYHTASEVNYYVIDFGSEALKMFQDCPIVGDLLYADDEEKINNLYKMLTTTIETRKELFAEYNGDFETYCKHSGKTVSNIVVIINNYESYQETYGEFDDTLIVLSRECNKYGIYFLITVNTPNGMRFKLRQNFALIYALQQNSEDDYTTILGNVHKNYPAKYLGRGIMKVDDVVYEFQTAFPTEKERIPKFIKEKCADYKKQEEYQAKGIPTLPEIVTLKEIQSSLNKNSHSLVIGINKENLKVSKFNFNKNYTTIITGLDLSPTSTLVNSLIKQIIALQNASLAVLNAEEYTIEESSQRYYQYIDQEFNDFFESMVEFTKQQNELYVNNKYNKKIFKDKKPIYCIIIGIDAFKNRLSEENKLKFGEFFTNAKDLGIVNYIIVDSIDKIKKVELESWYKTCVNNNAGIWIGNGINDQFSLKVTKKIDEMKQEIPSNFCFVINRGKPEYVKYVEQFDLNKFK